MRVGVRVESSMGEDEGVGLLSGCCCGEEWVAATEARMDWGDWCEGFAGSRPAVTVVVEVSVEERSDDKIRRWTRIGRAPDVSSLIRDGRWLGVWMSMPATENRLSWEVDLRTVRYGEDVENMSSSTVGD
jgi:hypothetical protein